MHIRIDDLTGPDIRALLMEHLALMHELSPPESVHALDIAGLRQPDITFWSIWKGPVLAGCIALKELNRKHGEIKSMKTARAMLREGVGSQLVAHLLQEAQRRDYRRLSLETGSADYFLPARKLYAKFGFVECGPFGDYSEDPNSTFMTLCLNDFYARTERNPHSG